MGELVAAGASENGRALERAAGAGMAEGVDGGDERVAALEKEVRLLDEILVVWRSRALDGDPVAVEKVLELQKQRLVLLQLWPAAASGVKVSAGAAARSDEREVRVVVEYVDDWRQVGRRSED